MAMILRYEFGQITTKLNKLGIESWASNLEISTISEAPPSDVNVG